MSALIPPEKNPLPTAAIFIIGPYAEKWFSARQSKRQDDRVRWIVAQDAAAMQQTLQRIRATNRRLHVSTFFPFFPDGEENVAQTLAQIAKWQRLFLHQQETFPCVLALYARLSQESAAGQARWSGDFNLNSTGETPLKNELDKLLTLPEPLSRHALHRRAMTDALRLWLLESGVEKALHALFSASSLRLNAVLLADNGSGFTRHGAWAQWLQQKFGLCPGLAAGIELPVLPRVVSHNAPLPVQLVVQETPRAFLRWLPIATALLLASGMIGATWLEARRITAVERDLAVFRQTHEMQLQTKRALYQQLLARKQQLLSCRDAWYHWPAGFSRCGEMVESIDRALQEYNLSPIFMPSGSVALFNQGSAALRPDSSDSLASLLPLIRDNAQTTFAIVGHADNTGSNETNVQLSMRRAQAVRDWLVAHAGVSPDRFVIKGMGASKPVASNQTGEGREKNRRVEVIPLPDFVHQKQVKDDE
ncbi:OmpA family protein [Erwinia sp. CGal63]|uniref:OmpA family protein n=1 Tax=Erwinia sp. CGal63 TaxID=2919889 RepID=UPI0030081C78